MSAPPQDEWTWEDRRRRLGIMIAERVAKWDDVSGVQGVIWDLSGSHGASMTGSTLNYYGDIHTLGELAARTDAELQAIPRLGPVGLGLVREVLRLWRDKQAGGKQSCGILRPEARTSSFLPPALAGQAGVPQAVTRRGRRADGPAARIHERGGGRSWSHSRRGGPCWPA